VPSVSCQQEAIVLNGCKSGIILDGIYLAELYACLIMVVIPHYCVPDAKSYPLVAMPVILQNVGGLNAYP
jgi:hypothetical protein